MPTMVGRQKLTNGRQKKSLRKAYTFHSKWQTVAQCTQRRHLNSKTGRRRRANGVRTSLARRRTTTTAIHSGSRTLTTTRPVTENATWKKQGHGSLRGYLASCLILNASRWDQTAARSLASRNTKHATRASTIRYPQIAHCLQSEHQPLISLSRTTVPQYYLCIIAK